MSATPTLAQRPPFSDELETLARLKERAAELRQRWQAATPFHYIVIDDFLPRSFAEAIYESYPRQSADGWDRTTYTHQKKKRTRRSEFPTQTLPSSSRLAARSVTSWIW